MSLVEVKLFNISSACYKQPKWVVPQISPKWERPEEKKKEKWTGI